MVTYVKISELPPATEATGADELEVNQAGVTRKITVDQIADVVAEILPPPVSDWADITGKPDFDALYVNTAGDTMTGALSGTTATLSTAIPAASNDTTVPTTAWVKANAGSSTTGGDFCANQTSSFPAMDTGYTTLILTQILSGNSTGSYSTSTGRYTPPAGRYFISASYSASCGAASHYYLVLRKNGAAIQTSISTLNTSTWNEDIAISATVDSNGTDYFDLQGQSSGGPATFNALMFLAYPISGIKGPPGDATPGTLIQMVSTQTGAVATGTTILPIDDTIPQITEGTEFMTLAITPRSATSKLVVNVLVNLSFSVAANNVAAALFQDSTANALTSALIYQSTLNAVQQIRLSYVVTSGTTSSTTFRVRAGGQVAGTLTFNGNGGLPIFGGNTHSSIVITETAT